MNRYTGSAIASRLTNPEGASNLFVARPWNIPTYYNSVTMPLSTTLIYGPTASGKTQVALQILKDTPESVLLSYDSRQMYQGMDIVVGKDIPSEFSPEASPTGSFLQSIRYRHHTHHLYGFDIAPPDQELSVSHYYRFVRALLAQLRADFPHDVHLILVGGSWQYAEVLFQPPESLFVPPNHTLRQQLFHLSKEQLQTKLTQLDPERWELMHPSDQHNPRRLVRAIEVAETKRKFPIETPSALLDRDSMRVILTEPDLNTLEPRIRQRLEERWLHGAQEETERLMRRYPDWNSPAFLATGYRDIRAYIEGKQSEATTKQHWWQLERSYAKRQLTWVKHIKTRFPQAQITTPLGNP